MDLETLSRQIAEIHADVREVKEFVLGPKEGLALRVDRLEQKAEGHRWGVRLALGGALTAAGHAIWQLITGGQNPTGH